jgi:hypothetical protein
MSDIIEYEQVDLDRAREIIELGFLLDSDRRRLTLSDEDVKSVARSYYRVRMRTFNPETGQHF